MNWFRFYSEAVTDNKLRRVARLTQQAPATVIGIWAILLCMASESPERGKLMIGNVAATEDDIADIAGCNVSETLLKLEETGLVTRCNNTLCVTAWDKRQYTSDNSTQRVQKHRSQARTTPDETGMKRFSNVSETHQRQIQNTDTDTDTETETETETETDGTLPAAAVSADYALACSAFQDNIGFVSPMIAEKIKYDLEEYPVSWFVEAVEITVTRGKNSINYVEGILERWRTEGKGNQRNGNGNGYARDERERDPYKGARELK